MGKVLREGGGEWRIKRKYDRKGGKSEG